MAFIDEISRCRPDMKNKLIPIIHERRVQGLELERLLYRWSAMNPPLRDDDEEDEDPAARYRGSEPLDLALADRFASIVEVPGWTALSEHEQEQVIMLGDDAPDPDASRELRARIEEGLRLLGPVSEQLGAALALSAADLFAASAGADQGDQFHVSHWPSAEV